MSAFDAISYWGKVTVEEMTEVLPLAAVNGAIYLAWAGTDNDHHLNTAQVGI
jgi:hypothetical protein